MKTSRHLFNAQEIRSRAAEIRKRWSPAERLRRTGLPPDVPDRLRDYILGKPALEWEVVRSEHCRGG
jgi:hypothetical protein